MFNQAWAQTKEVAIDTANKVQAVAGDTPDYVFWIIGGIVTLGILYAIRKFVFPN